MALTVGVVHSKISYFHSLWDLVFVVIPCDKRYSYIGLGLAILKCPLWLLVGNCSKYVTLLNTWKLSWVYFLHNYYWEEAVLFAILCPCGETEIFLDMAS
jgi:hypothetical protein